jgi:hypothetical protein
MQPESFISIANLSLSCDDGPACDSEVEPKGWTKSRLTKEEGKGEIYISNA